MYKRRIAIGELKVGMWVVELDRAWLGTPFDFQGFPIVSEEQIASVREYCKHVYVDPEREGAALPAPREVLAPTPTPEEKVVVTRAVYEECERAVQEAFAGLQRDAKIDAARLKHAMSDVTATMQQSPDSVVLLHQLNQKSSFELRRAMDSSVLMIEFGRHIGSNKDRLEVLGLAGMLLDVGKIKIPDEVLNKTGMLTPEEYQLMKSHVIHSVDLVHETGRLPAEVEEIILQHHERRDGTGYPYGLKNGAISLGGSIAAIVDSFSAMTSESCFAGPMAPSQALNHLHEMRGSAFDGELVEQFIECIGVYPIGSAVELNSNEIGIVMAQHPSRKLLPSVMLVLDANKRPLPEPQLIIDLSKEPRTKSGEPYRIRRGVPIESLPIDRNDLSLSWLPPLAVNKPAETNGTEDFAE